MRQVTEQQEVIDLLSSYEFMMFNKENGFKGELTTLDEKDINDILYDMKVSLMGKKTTVEVNDEGTVFVKYPFNICTMESQGKL